MTALTAARQTAKRSALLLSVALAAAAIAYEGGMAAVNSAGNVVPASANSALRVIGVFKDTVDNSAGAAGDLSVDVDRGCFRFANSAGVDAITAAHINKTCYVVDDQTVALTSNGGARPAAGKIVDVDTHGVWVDFSQGVSGVPLVLCLGTVSTKGSDAARVSVVAPCAGKINIIRSAMNNTLATGDATLTTKINATNVTGGGLTLTQAGSAVGDVDEATPTAANTFSKGDVISVTGGGASTATGTANVQVEVTPT